MKAIFNFSLLVMTIILFACQQQGHQKVVKIEDKLQVVEASCGECNFKLKGKSCDLAVKINGKAYFVDGTGIDDHGDAHADNGFCESIRKAEVKGKLVNNRFKATYFKLLPQ